MPQLVKGGKYVFGWSVVSEDGVILIPDEAKKEYQLNLGEEVVFLPGSKTSGGFSVARKSLVEQSKLSDLVKSRIPYQAIVGDHGQISLPPEMLDAYGVKSGDCLLVLRGSYIGVGMAVRGPLVEEARKHPELAVFQLGTS